MSKPIIPWPGGKGRLVKHILPLIGEHRCYVEPFAGAAAVYFAKEPSKVEVLNDINGELINLYRVVQHHLEEFVRQFKWALSSRQLFEWQRETKPETLTDIQRAARFYYIQKLAFGARATSPTFGTATTSPPRLNLLRIEEDLTAAHLRLSATFIEHVDWRDVIRRYDRAHTFFFIDPPYLETAGYGVAFGREDHVELAETVRSLKGQALVTVNDHKALREAYKGLRRRRVSISYTIGGGRRPKAAQELLIQAP